MAVKIALAGNPNCGKTTLFNALTGSNQFVGNWPGVTVEKKEGKLKGHKDVTIMDLPGIYSLSPYTLEEVVARNYLIGERPDAIINIVDGTNIERNLYLSTQIMELGIRIGNGEIFIDFVAPDTRINDIQLGIPVSINIENGVAAMALAHLNGVTDEEIKRGMASFRGVDRRFDFKIKNDRIVFLSDYAHHPSEIKQSVLSMRELYKDKKITAIFQPHLYTRTRDFYQDFADSLSLLDEVILVDIYPAREAPIPGVTSKLIYDNLRPGIEKSMCKKEDILNILKDKNIEVLITLGAGDIDNYVPEIKELLETKKLRMNNEE